VHTADRRAAIMVVDSSEAFATMLCEYLEREGGYRVTAKTSGRAALAALEVERYDLAIVDLGLSGEDGSAVAHDLRRHQADLRLMLIPLDGETLPPEVVDLDIQGVLSKPFFLPGLLPRVEEALTCSVENASHSELDIVTACADCEPGGTASIGTVSVDSEFDDSELNPVLHDLANELNAEAVILSQQGQLLAQASKLSADAVDRLVQVVVDSWRTSIRVAEILGKEQLRFEQSIEGGEYVFYSLAVSEDMILSVALQYGIPLGMLRHRAKETVDEIRTVFAKERYVPERDLSSD